MLQGNFQVKDVVETGKYLYQGLGKAETDQTGDYFYAAIEKCFEDKHRDYAQACFRALSPAFLGREKDVSYLGLMLEKTTNAHFAILLKVEIEKAQMIMERKTQKPKQMSFF